MTGVQVQQRSGQQTVVAIQLLRGLAALMVAYQHVAEQIAPLHERLVFDNAQAGVDIFFVISGFIMVHTSSGMSRGRFVYRRLTRIVPLYWSCLALVALLVLAAPGLFRTTVLEPSHLLRDFLFIPNENPGHPGVIMPLLNPGWTLNYEMFFYLVFTAVIPWPTTRKIVALGLVFAALVGLGLALGPAADGPLLGTYTDPLFFEFLAGMILAHWYGQGRRLPAPLGGLCVLAGLVLLVPPVGLELRVVDWGIPALLLVFGALNLEPRLGGVPLRPFRWLGDISYSLYLGHFFGLGVLRVVWARLDPSGNGPVGDGPLDAWLFAGAGLAASILAGAALYYGCERPLSRAARALEKRFGRNLSKNR